MLDTATHPVLPIPPESAGCNGSSPTDPILRDTDADTVIDGAECLLGSDPTVPDEPPLGVDNDSDRLSENTDDLLCPSDVDGDGLAGDDDQDCDFFDPSHSEFIDGIEWRGYGTMPNMVDSDGDGCADWKEIVDVNGNRQAEVTDVMFISKRALGLMPPSDSDAVLDIDKNGSVQTSDALMAAQNSVLVKPHAACPAEW